MANFKIPGWFVHFHYQHRSGKFNPGGYQERSVTKPTGQYNTGSFQEQSLPSHYKPNLTVPGHMQKRDVAKATGQDPRTYQDPTGLVDKDPWGAYYFSLEIDDVEVAHFLECSGLKTSAEVFEIEEGGYITNVHKRTGRSKWEHIILKKAVYTGHLFAEWRQYYMGMAPADGESEWKGWKKRQETTAAIVMRANSGEELRRYSIFQPWPVSWEGPSLSSGGSALSEETLEIAHEGILFGRPAEPAPPEPPPPEPQPPMQTPTFNFDEDTYTPQGQAAMEQNVNTVSNDPEAKTYYVEGHTCDLGSHGHNQDLSYRRALAQANDLKNANANNNYHPKGYSYDHPVAPNDIESNRAQNRRGGIFEDQRAGKRSGEMVYQPMGKNGKKAPRY